MLANQRNAARSGARRWWRSDVNGLFLVLAALIALMLLPGPGEADYQPRHIEMNNIVTVDDMKK